MRAKGSGGGRTRRAARAVQTAMALAGFAVAAVLLAPR